MAERGRPVNRPRAVRSLGDANDLEALSDEQRDTLAAWYADNPRAGYKLALAEALGLSATKANAKRLIAPESHEDPRLETIGAGEASLEYVLATIAHDIDAKDTDRINAAKFLLGALHGVSEKQRLEVDGELEVGNGELSSAVDRFTAAVAAATVRAAAGDGTGDAAGGALGRGEG